MILRGEIYQATLDPVVGSEQGGTRPVVVLQNNKGNKHSPTVIVAPLTTKTKNLLPTHVKTLWGLVLLEQVRVLDKSRLKKKLGRISNMREVTRRLMISLQ